MSETPSGRLRTPPQERFAAPAEVFDLNAATDRLMKESSNQHGHRQMTLFRHGPATLALYCFDKGAKLPDHVVDGPVILQVLQGRLTVHIDDTHHTLSQGGILRLAPNVPHDVFADEASHMLLTICLEGPGSHVVQA